MTESKMISLTLNQSDFLRLDQGYLLILEVVFQLTKDMPLSFIILANYLQHLFALVPHD